MQSSNTKPYTCIVFCINAHSYKMEIGCFLLDSIAKLQHVGINCKKQGTKAKHLVCASFGIRIFFYTTTTTTIRLSIKKQTKWRKHTQTHTITKGERINGGMPCWTNNNVFTSFEWSTRAHIYIGIIEKKNVICLLSVYCMTSWVGAYVMAFFRSCCCCRTRWSYIWSSSNFIKRIMRTQNSRLHPLNYTEFYRLFLFVFGGFVKCTI